MPKCRTIKAAVAMLATLAAAATITTSASALPKDPFNVRPIVKPTPPAPKPKVCHAVGAGVFALTSEFDHVYCAMSLTATVGASCGCTLRNYKGISVTVRGYVENGPHALTAGASPSITAISTGTVLLAH